MNLHKPVVYLTEPAPITEYTPYEKKLEYLTLNTIIDIKNILLEIQKSLDDVSVPKR